MEAKEPIKLLEGHLSERDVTTINRALREARQDERKKILAVLKKEYPAITTWQCWKALTEGKEL